MKLKEKLILCIISSLHEVFVNCFDTYFFYNSIGNTFTVQKACEQYLGAWVAIVSY